MSEHDSLVERLAALVGIADAYTDAFGFTTQVSIESQRAILTGFGLAIETESTTRASLELIERLRLGPCPPLLPVLAGRNVRIPLRSAGQGTAVWRLTAENGVVREGRATIGARDGAGALQLPALAPGYYALRLAAAGTITDATVIAAPRRCWEPEDLRAGARLWGATAQVYSLRTVSNLGIGEFTDLARAAAGVAVLGASFLGLSPLHALFGSDRTKVSPYSPSSRLFLETLHIDPTAVPGFADSAAARLLASGGVQGELRRLREAPLIDHAAVWSVKGPLLEALWPDVGGRAEASGLEAFRRQWGDPLEAHATFEVLSEHFLREGRFWLGDWPQAFRDPRSPAVAEFRAGHGERVAFHAWLQWLADTQLAGAARRARAGGMPIGLYRDLAVGADRGGSEVWAAPERFGTGLAVGAPPDPIAPQGQDWGLPPFNPLALETQGLAAFRALVAANMRHAGAIRLDHAFQLRRLFLIPLGAGAARGAYVDYPFEAMLAVLRLESHRAQCLIIAEDLGNAPEGFSDAIMDAGLLSYRVLSFERTSDGAFKRPGDYPRRALSVITTHDLPTFAGWWRGLDVDLRQTLGLCDRDTAAREREARGEDRQRLSEALAAEKLIPAAEPPAEPPLEAAVRYLARTRASLAALQFEDAAGELNQANLPGLDQGHPNWQRRLTIGLDDLIGPGGELAKLSTAFAGEGRGLRPLAGSLASPPPRATYRVQFHKDFSFDDAVAIVPYLARLGVSHLYGSPIHRARPGSTHGYDIVDHAAINPELGGQGSFLRLSEALKAEGLGLLLDIVPNHMGIGGADNGWWLSVLEWGELSPHGRAFDIDWERLGANHKLVVPFLGARYGEALEKGDLKLAFDAAAGSFSVRHFEHRFPICPLHYPIVLDRALAACQDPAAEAAMLALSEHLRSMAAETAPERRAGFPAEADALKRRLAAAVADSASLAAALERAAALINGSPGIPESFGTLHRMLEAQAYRLAHWRVAASDINYRRFFDINGLAGLRIEEPDIFASVHATVFRLVREGRIDGLRIDHIDGLADPEGYVRALQGVVGPGFYVVVEKILEPGEELRAWPVAGTTGYEALNLIDGVFVDTGAARTFDRIYREATGTEGSYAVQLSAAKREILEIGFASELEGLISDLKRVAEADRGTRDYTLNALRRALVDIIASFPVYRSYLGIDEASATDRALIAGTVEEAKRSSALPDRTVHDFVAAALLGDIDTEGSGRPEPGLVRRFRRRFQQLTGPVMAKSLEDTLFYRYGRLLALNEVGGDPGHFGIGIETFHQANAKRLDHWPHSMIATATHDTKRGEDARARLLALSEMPDAWREALAGWSSPGPDPSATETAAPDANDRYMMLQALLGAWPMELLDGTEAEALAAFRERFQGYVVKALREGKRHSSWVNPDEAYENAATALARDLLAPDGAFLDALRPLAQRLAFLGMLTSLSRTVLKCTVPGVPDTYQGTEFWDLALVDPDNRRPVDYAARERALADDRPAEALLARWHDGAIKQRLVARLLADRAAAPLLYATGDYAPLEVAGLKARHCLAFGRSTKAERLVVAVPRLVGGLVVDGAMPLGVACWGDTTLPVPEGRWRDVITGGERPIGPGPLAVGELFQRLPIAVLRMAS